MRTHSAYDQLSVSTHQPWFAGVYLVLRLTLGFVLLYAGLSKLGDWSAAGYLTSASGPLSGFFQGLAGSAVIDQLNVWGQILIGASLILGLFVRPASFFGAIMMILYYLAHFVENTALGPVDQHIIYAVIFVLLMAGGAGHVYGLDGLISRNIRKPKAWWSRILFG